MGTRDWINLPNAITVLRLLLVPVFIALFLREQFMASALCFAVASLTDGLDGMVARVLHQKTKLGAFLDALADKVLVFTALVLLVIAEITPLWLLAVIVFRDGCMIVGTFVVRRKNLDLPAAPSRVGKYATFSLMGYSVLAFFLAAGNASPWIRAYAPVLGFVAGLCVIVSTVQYFARFGHLLFDPPRRNGNQPT